MGREDRIANRAARRDYRASQGSSRREARAARQSARQGFIANLAPQVLDKINLGGAEPQATLPTGYRMDKSDFDAAKDASKMDLGKILPIVLALIFLPKIMKK